MDIHQLQASYQIEQDRILLRMNTRTREVFSLWLTRRMLKGFLPHLTQLVTRSQPDTSNLISHDSAQPDALANFQKQESVALADYATPFAGASPLQNAANAPLLVTKVHLTPLGDAGMRLGFEEQEAGSDSTRSIEVTLALPVLHNLVHLLEMVLPHADWGMVSAAQPPPEPVVEMDSFANAKPPTYLN
jgi:hypothetical protein